MNTTTRRLTYYADPGHGWLAVDRADLDKLDIAHRISKYSYQRGETVYLEEDCDAAVYMDAAKTAGWRINITEQYNDPSPVRGFARYQQQATPAALVNMARRIVLQGQA